MFRGERGEKYVGKGSAFTMDLFDWEPQWFHFRGQIVALNADLRVVI